MRWRALTGPDPAGHALAPGACRKVEAGGADGAGDPGDSSAW